MSPGTVPEVIAMTSEIHENVDDGMPSKSYNFRSEPEVIFANDPSSITGPTDRGAIQVPSDAPTLRVPKVEISSITLRLPAIRTVLYQPARRSWAAEHTYSDRMYPDSAYSTPYGTTRLAPPRPGTAPARAERVRDPAPLGLRVTVLVLLVIFLTLALGFVAVRVRPNIFRSLRNMVTLPTVTPPRPIENGFRTTGKYEYVVPASSYSITVEISHPCWILIRQLGSNATLFAATVQPANSTKAINVTGGVSVEVAARASAIIIREGSHTLGMVNDPVVGATYTFASR